MITEIVRVTMECRQINVPHPTVWAEQHSWLTDIEYESIHDRPGVIEREIDDIDTTPWAASLRKRKRSRYQTRVTVHADCLH